VGGDWQSKNHHVMRRLVLSRHFQNAASIYFTHHPYDFPI